MRVGVFGGSFDPVHLGHLWIAESAAEALGLDQVRWIPAATSPLKPHGPRAPAEARVQMLRLALAGSSLHIVDDREVTRGKISFTVETLDSLRQEFPTDELFLIIGSDSLATLDQWRSPDKILSLAKLAVIQRAADPVIDWSVLDRVLGAQRRDANLQFAVTIPQIEISSGEMRERIRSGRSIRYRTPRAVESLIVAENLYRDGKLEPSP